MRFPVHAMEILHVFGGKPDADAAILVPEVVGGVSYILMIVLIRLSRTVDRVVVASFDDSQSSAWGLSRKRRNALPGASRATSSMPR